MLLEAHSVWAVAWGSWPGALEVRWALSNWQMPFPRRDKGKGHEKSTEGFAHLPLHWDCSIVFEFFCLFQTNSRSPLNVWQAPYFKVVICYMLQIAFYFDF